MVLRHVVLVVFFLLDIADLLSDWLLYYDFSTQEQGLVYGPLDQDVIWALLAFSIIGTVTFIVECFILRYEWARAREDEDAGLLPDIISAVVIWIEDIPQVIISFSIALCRQDAISIFQLSKAAVIIVGILVRLLATCIRYVRKNRSNKCTCCIKAFLLAGMVLELGFSSAIFVLNHTSPHSKGDIVFRVPTTVIEETFDSSPYLDNVSLFVNHRELFDADHQGMFKGDTEVGWLRLFSVHNLKEDDNKLLFNIEYEYTAEAVFNMAVLVRSRYTSTDNPKAHWMVSGCYTINQTSSEIIEHTNVTCANTSFFSSDANSLLMKFRFEDPNKNLLFRKRPIGEIYANVKLRQNGTCSSVEYNDYPQRGHGQNTSLTFHYFQVTSKVDPLSAKHLLNEKSGSPRFFRNDGLDMEDVKSVWKTGWSECPATGSTSPARDTGMDVGCESMLPTVSVQYHYS